MPRERYSEVINSNFFSTFSKAEKKVLFDLATQGESCFGLSKKETLPVTFITNETLTAKLSLLIPALITSNDLHMRLVLDLNLPERKIVFNHLSLLKNKIIDTYPENKKIEGLSSRASYISLPPSVCLMTKKNELKTEDTYNNFITAIIINLLLCRPKAVFFLLSFGKGLFLKDYDLSRRLAKTLIEICRQLSVKTAYMIIHLDQPLGSSIGGKLVLKEVLDASQGNESHGFLKLAIEISAELMFISGIYRDKNSAKCHIKKQIINGHATDNLKLIWGYSASIFPHIDLKSNISSPSIKSIPFLSPATGFIQPFPVERIRKLQEKLIDRMNISGLIFNKKSGEKVRKGETLATIIFSNGYDIKNIFKKIRSYFSIESKPPEFCPMIIERGNSNQYGNL